MVNINLSVSVHHYDVLVRTRCRREGFIADAQNNAVISTLIPDIYTTIQKKDGWFNADLAQSFSEGLAKRLQAHLGEERGKPTLRLSGMGPKCPCALWHSIHKPDQAEPLPPWAEIKYTYGHILEEMAIMLAKAAGHDVTGEQDELYVDGIRGHRDCIIDGAIVDVKSASSYSFAKFKDGSLRNNDPFGYLDQLDGYLVGSLDDPLVTIKDKAYIFGIDKTLGHMVLYEHEIREASIRDRIRESKRIVALDSPPPCECGTVPDGKSGNYKLDTKASYNSFKYCCFPQLRTFLYSDGPHYLTKVVRKPDVPEIDRHGNIIAL